MSHNNGLSLLAEAALLLRLALSAVKMLKAQDEGTHSNTQVCAHILKRGDEYPLISSMYVHPFQVKTALQCVHIKDKNASTMPRLKLRSASRRSIRKGTISCSKDG